MKREFEKFVAPSMTAARKRINKETKKIVYNVNEEYLGMGNGKYYLLKTYGCQGNLADSERIAGLLETLGFVKTNDDEKADVIIFNTCAIRENAENRVFGELGRIKNLKKNNPNLIMAICGCMPQEEKIVNIIKEKYDQVDIIFGTHNIHKLDEYLYDVYKTKNRVVEVYSYEGDIVENVPVVRDHNRKAWVNIMYGCDEFCTYCIVPYTRGKERSRKPEDIINEVNGLVEDGYLEVTLLGQNVNAYGKDFSDRNYTFANLLEDLSKTNITRIRFTTSHPRDLDDETISVMGKFKNIMPHLHLPVQSGSNKILKKMNRKYTKEDYLDKIAKLKKAVPGISITTDIIVAFPGEDEKDFLDTLDLVKKVDFEGAFTFIYSPREGTPAATYQNLLTEDEKKTRLLALNEIINDGYARGNKRFEGEIVKVLVDGVSNKNNNILTGYTEHEKVVNFAGDKELIGKIVDVKIEKAFSWHLRGKLVK